MEFARVGKWMGRGWLFAAVTCCVQAVGAAESDVENFGSGVVPSFISSTGSTLECVEGRNHHGRYALEWRWEQGAELVLAVPESDKPPTDFQVWVHSEAPNGALDIRWGNQQVRYELNFTGWRSLWLLLNRDGLEEGQLPAEAETIRIKPTAPSGKLKFDLLEITRKGILHGRLGNDQMPFVVNDPENRHNYPWIARQFDRVEPLPAATPENLRHYERIEESIRQILVPKKVANPRSRIAKASPFPMMPAKA